MNKLWVPLLLLLLPLFLSGAAHAEATESVVAEQKQQGFVGLTKRDAWSAGEAALTFDDGPLISRTPKVLNLLKEHQLQATFFVVGQNINRYTYPLIVRMVREGHRLGSHSYNHDVKMAFHNERTVTDYICGQHEVTQILVNLALVAESPEDFEKLYFEVFQLKPNRLIPNDALAQGYRVFASRLQALLARYGYTSGQVPYPILYTRPPGGGPYFSRNSEDSRHRYDVALGQLGSINVLWHGGCWDPDPNRRKDYQFILTSLLSQVKQGGIIVIHDYVRFDALADAIGRIASDPKIRIVPLEPAVMRKYGCTAAVVVATLKNNASGFGSQPVEQVSPRLPTVPPKHQVAESNQLLRHNQG